MPAESARLRHRVRARDRWFLGVLAGGALLATPTAVVLRSSSPDPGPGPRCVSTIVAGFMGGETHTACGTRAAALCRSGGRRDAALAASCLRKGFFLADPAPP